MINILPFARFAKFASLGSSLCLLCLFSPTLYAQEAESVPQTQTFPQNQPDQRDSMQMTDVAQVSKIIDPLRFSLTDGRIVQLTPLEIPDMDPYEPGAISLAAQAFLQEHLPGREVRLYQNRNRPAGMTNRMGHTLAQIERKGRSADEPDMWVQGALLAQGLARVRPSADHTEMATELLAAEEQARQERRGLWEDENGPYAIKTPDNAQEALNGWAIVEGRVYAQGMSSNKIYLNFDQDWRTDFTIGIAPAVRRQLAQDGFDPLNGFTGRLVRVRGWVERYNGPYIELSHPAWIQILPE